MLAFPKPRSRASEKRRKAAAHAAATAELRRTVFARAKGCCEACGMRRPLRLDHWLGGSGRRRQLQSPETTWALCATCDSHRTHNVPSAGHWNDVRRAFCERLGFPFHPHITHSAPAGLQ